MKMYITAATEEYVEKARELSAHLGISFRDCSGEAFQSAAEGTDDEVFLCIGSDGLSLNEGGLTVRPDFTSLLPRLKEANLRGEFLVKAARIKNSEGPLTAVDATAGLGEDSLILAAAGFTVTMYEYDPVIAALLRDALLRASLDPALSGITARMTLIEGSSIEALPKLSFTPDVILLDPMFPERKKSASVKKKFQLLHCLEKPCSNEEELLKAAMEAHPKKIIIKRPTKGPFLAGIKPGYSLSGKAVRYDVIY